MANPNPGKCSISAFYHPDVNQGEPFTSVFILIFWGHIFLPHLSPVSQADFYFENTPFLKKTVESDGEEGKVHD